MWVNIPNCDLGEYTRLGTYTQMGEYNKLGVYTQRMERINASGWDDGYDGYDVR